MLTTARRRDLRIAVAHGSDPEAQRWLGWRRRDVLSPRQIARTRRSSPGGEYVEWQRPPFRLTVQVAPSTVSGHVALYVEDGQWHLGIHLAPELRGRGHGRRALVAAVDLCHQHLGLGTVLAVTHLENVACLRALAAAGFTPVPGPGERRLPSGRVIPTLWFVHTAPTSRRCRWFDLRSGATG